MSHRGKNKAPRTVAAGQEEPWFKARKRRQKKRRKMEKIARRKNR